MRIQVELDNRVQPVRYPTCAVLKHKYENFFMPIIYNKAELSLSRLKKKVLNADVEWSHWVTLTFADKPFIWMKGRHILPTQFHNNAKLVSYIHSPRWHNFSIIDLYKISSEWLRVWKNRFKMHYKRKGLDIEFTHVWKYEEGDEHSRPHFHFIIKTNLCTTCLYFALEAMFPYGFVDCKKITSEKFLKSYLNKYFKKGTTFKYWNKGRRWGSSRDIKPVQTESDFTCDGVSKDYYNCIELLESTGHIMSEYYESSWVYYKCWSRLINVFCKEQGVSVNDYVETFHKEGERRLLIAKQSKMAYDYRKTLDANKFWWELPVSEQAKILQIDK